MNFGGWGEVWVTFLLSIFTVCHFQLSVPLRNLSDRCVLSAIVCLQIIFLTSKSFDSFTKSSFFWWKNGCMFVSFWPCRSCSPHVHTFSFPPKRKRPLRFFIFMKILFCSPPGGRFVPLLFWFPSTNIGATHFSCLKRTLAITPSPPPPQRPPLPAAPLPSIAIFSQALQHQRRCFCSHLRHSCVSHECFFQSIHIKRLSICPHTPCHTHLSFSQCRQCVNPCQIISLLHCEVWDLSKDYVLTDYPVQWNRLIIELPKSCLTPRGDARCYHILAYKHIIYVLPLIPLLS